MRRHLEPGKLDVRATDGRDASGHNTLLLLTHTLTDPFHAVRVLGQPQPAGPAELFSAGSECLTYLCGDLHRADGQDLGRDGPRAAGEGIAAQCLGALQLAAQSVLSGCSWVALQQLSQGSNIAACLLHPWQTRGWPGAPVAEGLQDERGRGGSHPDRAQRGILSQPIPWRIATQPGASFTELLHRERQRLPASGGTWTGQQCGVTLQWELGALAWQHGCCLARHQTSGRIAQGQSRQEP